MQLQDVTTNARQYVEKCLMFVSFFSALSYRKKKNELKKDLETSRKTVLFCCSSLYSSSFYIRAKGRQGWNFFSLITFSGIEKDGIPYSKFLHIEKDAIYNKAITETQPEHGWKNFNRLFCFRFPSVLEISFVRSGCQTRFCSMNI